jgi:hypothetical protein
MIPSMLKTGCWERLFLLARSKGIKNGQYFAVFGPDFHLST